MTRDSDYAHTINRHYGAAQLSARILERLRAAGKDPATITRDDLATFDEFHTGGRESTRGLARLVGLRPGIRVLDVGSGIGGPARTLAAEFGAEVVGLDLTEEFCRAATTLTELVGLADRVTFRHGDALTMPFEDGRFDVVWSQNSIMNIPDQSRLFAEVHRVLVPGGTLALEAVFAGPVEGVIFPTFWASAPELNFLMTPAAARALLGTAGFREVRWEDTTADTLDHARRRRPPPPVPEAAPALGRDTIVLEDVARKIENAVRNLEGERIVTVRAVLRRSDPSTRARR
ncbi:MAG TPA: methyltransferase domain-containing protein [Gemmatimonadales bacterium]|nr:methyltransferase domain-containing protein [Gemmatimonadales bacterium]